MSPAGLEARSGSRRPQKITQSQSKVAKGNLPVAQARAYRRRLEVVPLVVSSYQIEPKDCTHRESEFALLQSVTIIPAWGFGR
jgi:hypothetical protein